MFNLFVLSHDWSASHVDHVPRGSNERRAWRGDGLDVFPRASCVGAARRADAKICDRCNIEMGEPGPRLGVRPHLRPRARETREEPDGVQHVDGAAG